MKLLFSAILLSLCASAALVSSPSLNAGEFNRRVWRIEDGLPQNRIQSISQTPDGYLWIGTSEGLARFDGVRFTIFDQSNTPALHDDGILALAISRDGALWIGTEGAGLVRYDHGAFTSFSTRDGLTNGFVRAVHEDRYGTLWVGTDRGFFRREGARFTRLDGTPEIPLATVGSLAEDSEGQMWGSSSVGLVTVVRNKLTRVHPDCATLMQRTFLASSGRSVFALGPDGSRRLENGCLIPDPDVPAVPLVSMIVDSQGYRWIGTMGNGVIRSRGGRTESIGAASGLPGNTANAVFEDREHNLWIGCEDGLVRLTRTSGAGIGSRDGLEDEDVITVYQDRGAALWMITLTGQAYRSTGASVTRYRLPAPATDFRLRTVFEDSGGAYWFGTLGSGVVRQKSGAISVYDRNHGLRSNSVRAMLEDASGAVWFALDSGLSRWDGHGFRNYYLEDGLSYPSTRCLFAEHNGDILVGTDSGLNRLRNGNIVRDSEFSALANERIWAVYRDGDGTLWIGTRGGGLLRLREGVLSRFTKENGLPANTIFGIVEDAAGKLWMSTSSGIASVNRRELDSAVNRQGQVVRVIPFDAATGVSTSQMNGGLQPAAVLTTSGDLWFPSVKGAIRIHPSARSTQQAANAMIERVVADNQSFPVFGDISIPPGHGRLAIDFTLCDLGNPQRVSFRYKLEGFDDNWTAALRTRSANYTNVPPGHYRFRVEASDASSVTASEASIAISLAPAFYRTPWFYTLLALAAACAVWAGSVFYARQTRARYAVLLAERTRLAREMHDTVIQGCVGVATLLEASAGFRKVDGAEADRFLDDARTQVTTTLEEARQAVWDLRHQAPDESSIGMLFELARKLGEEHGIRIETRMAGSAQLNPEIDRTVLLVGREALRNAVAHASANFISLRIVKEPTHVSLEVADDGGGLPPGVTENGEGKHFGLVGMRERVEGAGGSFSLESKPGGTTVTARIPL